MEWKYKFSSKDLMAIKKAYNMLGEPNEKVLEEWVYRVYDMKHNGSITLGKITKFTVRVVELP
jgi:hypothetical protein